MFSRIALTASTILALTFAASAAQAGYVYYPDEEYVVHHRHHVVVEDTEGYHHQRHGYYQKKVLINEHPTYQTCHYITSWDAEGHPLPVEDCK